MMRMVTAAYALCAALLMTVGLVGSTTRRSGILPGRIPPDCCLPRSPRRLRRGSHRLLRRSWLLRRPRRLLSRWRLSHRLLRWRLSWRLLWWRLPPRHYGGGYRTGYYGGGYRTGYYDSGYSDGGYTDVGYDGGGYVDPGYSDAGYGDGYPGGYTTANYVGGYGYGYGGYGGYGGGCRTAYIPYGWTWYRASSCYGE